MRVSSKLPGIQRQVDCLETAGFKVRLHHDSEETGHVSGVPYRGHSAVTIERSNSDGTVTSGLGDSFCSLNDMFDRATGTRIAFGRALDDLSGLVGRNAMKEIFSNDV